MKPERDNYKLGESVYDSETGFFLGTFVDNLTDDLPGEGKAFKENVMALGPIGEYKFAEHITTHKVYSRRTVFSYRFGVVKQILVKSIDDDLVWINI